jgi:hypothetical protein
MLKHNKCENVLLSEFNCRKETGGNALRMKKGRVLNNYRVVQMVLFSGGVT